MPIVLDKTNDSQSELINSIEITIAIDILELSIAIAIAIVKRISQLLLLIRSSISIDFFLVWNMLFLSFCSGHNKAKKL